MLVAKLTAVLKAESAETAPMPCGLKGRTPWTRWSRYTASKPSRLNDSMANAYDFQPISAFGQTPPAR